MTRREYRSRRRAEQSESTRRAILEAARRLFTERGYAGTSIAAIAEEAGVAVPTVYASVGGKPALVLGLQALIDEAGSVPELQQAIGRSQDAREVLGLIARIRGRMMRGAGDVIGLIAATAPASPEVAAAYEQGQRYSRMGIERGLTKVASLGALRPDLDVARATDIAYAVLHHAIYARLVDELGWTPDEFEAWCADALARLLLEDGAPARP